MEDFKKIFKHEISYFESINNYEDLIDDNYKTIKKLSKIFYENEDSYIDSNGEVKSYILKIFNFLDSHYIEFIEDFDSIIVSMLDYFENIDENKINNFIKTDYFAIVHHDFDDEAYLNDLFEDIYPLSEYRDSIANIIHDRNEYNIKCFYEDYILEYHKRNFTSMGSYDTHRVLGFNKITYIDRDILICY